MSENLIKALSSVDEEIQDHQAKVDHHNSQIKALIDVKTSIEKFLAGKPKLVPEKVPATKPAPFVKNVVSRIPFAHQELTALQFVTQLESMRTKAGLTRRDVSDKTDMDPSNIYLIENRKTNGLESIKRLAVYFNVKLTDHELPPVNPRKSKQRESVSKPNADDA